MYFLFLTPSYAESTLNGEDVASIASKVGLSTAKLWLNHTEVNIPASKLPLEEQSSKVEAALDRYQVMRNTFTGISTTTRAVQIGMGVTVGSFMILSGGTATLPVSFARSLRYRSNA